MKQKSYLTKEDFFLCLKILYFKINYCTFVVFEKKFAALSSEFYHLLKLKEYFK